MKFNSKSRPRYVMLYPYTAVVSLICKQNTDDIILKLPRYIITGRGTLAKDLEF